MVETAERGARQNFLEEIRHATMLHIAQGRLPANWANGMAQNVMHMLGEVRHVIIATIILSNPRMSPAKAEDAQDGIKKDSHESQRTKDMIIKRTRRIIRLKRNQKRLSYSVKRQLTNFVRKFKRRLWRNSRIFSKLVFLERIKKDFEEKHPTAANFKMVKVLFEKLALMNC